MHAVDQLLKYVGAEEFNDIPKMDEVPLTIIDLAEPGNKYVVENIQEWMSQFREDSDLWKNSFKDGNHSMPEAACNYIDMKTNNRYECLRNVFSMEISEIPDRLSIKSTYNVDDMKIISQYVPEIKQGIVSIDTDKIISDLEMVIFINTGNHWEIIYSPDIPQINNILPVEPVVKPVIKSDIKIGSNVKWTDKENELTGIVEKITKTSYKICCKPGKNSGDNGSQYMIKFDRVSLIGDNANVQSEEIIKSDKEIIESNDIIVGSDVKWTEKDTVLTGIVEKITKTSYKICCKPGKNSGDTSSQYMIKFDRVSLNKV
jgi:hypothetical protein